MRKTGYAFLWIFALSIPLQEAAASIFVEVAGTISRLIGLGAGLVAVVAIIQEGRLRRIPPVFAFIALFFAWGAISFLWSADQEATMVRLFTNIQLLLMVLVFSQYASTKEEVHGFLVAYVVGAAISIVELFRRLSSGIAMAPSLFENRYTAFDNNPNEYALALALAIPMAWYLVMVRRTRWEVVLGFAFIATGSLGVILTASRAGLLELVVGSLMIPLSLHRVPIFRKLVTIGMVVGGIVLMLSVTPEKVWNRLEKLEDLAPSHVPRTYYGVYEGPDIRTVIWKQGMNEFLNNPQVTVIGVGASGYMAGVEPLYGERFVAHNVFISVLVEQGIVGFTIFMIILWLVLSRIPYLDTDEKYVWIFTFATWFVGVNFMTWEYTKNTWFLIGLLASRTVMISRQSKGRRGLLAAILKRR